MGPTAGVHGVCLIKTKQMKRAGPIIGYNCIGYYSGLTGFNQSVFVGRSGSSGGGGGGGRILKVLLSTSGAPWHK